MQRLVQDNSPIETTAQNEKCLYKILYVHEKHSKQRNNRNS